MNDVEKRIIDAGLGEQGLPVFARMGEDPGVEYFDQLLSDLRLLFDDVKTTSNLSKELSYALYSIGHYPYIEYSSWLSRGASFRDTLINPHIAQVEMAVESIFSGQWSEYPFLPFW